MIVPQFVDALPAALYAPAFVDFATELAKQPQEWALWPGDEMDTGFRFQEAGEVKRISLGAEGPGGVVEFTRRAGRTYVRWIAW